MTDLTITQLRKELLLPVLVYDEDTMAQLDSFYAPSPPRVGEDFRGHTVVNVEWNHTNHTGVQVHVYAKKQES